MKILYQYISCDNINSIIFEDDGIIFFAHFLEYVPILKDVPIQDGILTRINNFNESFIKCIVSKSLPVRDPLGRTNGFIFDGLLLPIEPIEYNFDKYSPISVCATFKPSRLDKFDKNLQFLHLILKFIQFNKSVQVVIDKDVYIQVKNESLEKNEYTGKLLYAQNESQMIKWTLYLKSPMYTLHVNDYTMDQYKKYEIKQNNELNQNQTITVDDICKNSQFLNINGQIFNCKKIDNCGDYPLVDSLDCIIDGSIMQFDDCVYLFKKYIS
jgi:hypothetical protein